MTVNNGSRLIFIGGSPRSGTTLLQNMLDSHPLIIGGPEFLHIPQLVELRQKIHFSIGKGWIDTICKKDDVDNFIKSFIDDLLLPIADKRGATFYSEKTPENVLVFKEMIDLYPDAHFIHVVRDPRAIISSMQQVKYRAIEKGLQPPTFTRDINSSIKFVQRCFEAGFLASTLFPGKVLTVVYEKLVCNPEEETKRICNFMNIEWEQSMLFPAKQNHMGEGAITKKSNEIWYDANTYNRNPDAGDIDKWKKKLSLYNHLKVLSVFSADAELSRLNYDLSVETTDRLAHVRIKIISFIIGFERFVKNAAAFVLRRVPGIRRLKKVFTRDSGSI